MQSGPPPTLDRLDIDRSVTSDLQVVTNEMAMSLAQSKVLQAGARPAVRPARATVRVQALPQTWDESSRFSAGRRATCDEIV